MNENEELALTIDKAVKDVRNHDWLDVEARERVIKFALNEQLKDAGEVERIFAIIKQQPEY